MYGYKLNRSFYINELCVGFVLSVTQRFRTTEEPTVNPSATASGEGCLYKSLTPQELKQLKQSIVDEDFEAFDRLVEKNPR